FSFFLNEIQPASFLLPYTTLFRSRRPLPQGRGGRPGGRRAVTLRVDAVGAARVLAAHRDVTILCHLRPDADALGSSAGLARALRREGVVVHQSFDPGIVPDGLRVIPGAELVTPLADVRAGDCGHLAEPASEILMLDPHLSTPGFGTHMLLDPDAASTPSLMLDVLEAGGWPADDEIATALYSGLITDTGSFRWSDASA